MRYVDEDTMLALLNRAIANTNTPGDGKSSLPHFSLSAKQIRAKYPEMSIIFEDAVRQANKEIGKGVSPEKFFESAMYNFIIRATLDGFDNSHIEGFIEAINS